MSKFDCTQNPALNMNLPLMFQNHARRGGGHLRVFSFYYANSLREGGHLRVFSFYYANSLNC